MPRLIQRQTNEPQHGATNGEDEGTALGEGVLINGYDPQAARREHMRAQTTARQAVESRYGPLRGSLRPATSERRTAEALERDSERKAELAEIDAQHQAWLNTRTQGS